MTQIADLEPFNYFPWGSIHNVLAVGWLDCQCAFPTGSVSKEFFLKLCQMIQEPWQPPVVPAGVHHCNLCQFSRGGGATFEGLPVPSASGSNLFVPYDGKLYVAPILVAHYVDAHRYKPPRVFVEAIMACPPMNSMEYMKVLLANGGRSLIQKIKTQHL